MSAYDNDPRVAPVEFGEFGGTTAYAVAGPPYLGRPREGRAERLGVLWKSFRVDEQYSSSHEYIRQDLDEAIRSLIGDPQ